MQRAFFITAAAIAVTTEATKFEYTPENQILAELDSQVGGPIPEPTTKYGIPNKTDFWTGGKTARQPKLTDIIENKPDGYEKMRYPQKLKLIEQNTKYAADETETRAYERIVDWPHHTLQFLAKYFDERKIPCGNYVDPADELMQLWMLIYLGEERILKPYTDLYGYHKEDRDIVGRIDHLYGRDYPIPSLLQLRAARCKDYDRKKSFSHN